MISMKATAVNHHLLGTMLSLAIACATPARAGDVDFARDIQPILNAKCVKCHGGVKAAGGVSFVYEDRVVNFAADSGELVVSPRNLDSSEMFRRITSDDEGEMMPPPEAHPALTESQLSLIRRWIEQGAIWSGHWAFTPPTKPVVPTSQHDHLAVNEIDRFLFHRLAAEGLNPSGVEEPGRLLRRLSLGLTGLPPALNEVDSFEAAYAINANSAVEVAVDDLLSRPAFGERWATMWLDLVRYADSGGLGIDQRRTIWAYRDWVIQAFNDDLPFDDFTISQLAGDLLPKPTTQDLIATACNRNTQTNNEGGTDDEEFRMEAIVDRVNTTWQTWGGVTFGCVQCHDHPYDPFRHAEYYKFMAFMNNTADSDLNDDAPRLKVPNDLAKFAEVAALRESTLRLKTQIWTTGMELRDKTLWTAATSLTAGAQNGTKYAVEQHDGHAEFFATGTVSTKTETEIQMPAENFSDQPVTAVRLTVLPLNPATAEQNSEWGFVVTDLKAWIVAADGQKTAVDFRWSVPDVPWLPTDPWRQIEANGEHWAANSRIHYARQIVLVPSAPLNIGDQQQLEIHVQCNNVSGGSHPLVIKRGHVASTSDPRWATFADQDSDVHKWNAQLFEEAKRLNDVPGTSIPIMQQRADMIARPTHVFVRGNFMSKGDRVESGLPASLLKVAPASSDSATRLDMAQWWVSEQNPLTARVFVNRVWEQMFGIGIVPTLEDFGSSGDKPTHPELLDHLAIRFQRDHRWSVKQIVREIALSYAYRQSAKATPELTSRDPDNRLIARGPRLRLTAEFVRDQSLAVSGLLTTKIGGPPVFPPLPGGVWQPFDGGDKWKTAEPDDPDRYRRSIYTYMKRSIPFPTFATFDAPSREFCTPRRLTSNTPLQALVMLNDTAFVECAEALAKRMQHEFEGSVRDRLAAAYRAVTARQADANRLDQLLQLHTSLADSAQTNPWIVVAQVLLNLDEVLTY